MVAQRVQCCFNHWATCAVNVDLGCSLAGGRRTENISVFDLLDSASPAVCDVTTPKQSS